MFLTSPHDELLMLRRMPWNREMLLMENKLYFCSKSSFALQEVSLDYHSFRRLISNLIGARKKTCWRWERNVLFHLSSSQRAVPHALRSIQFPPLLLMLREMKPCVEGRAFLTFPPLAYPPPWRAKQRIRGQEKGEKGGTKSDEMEKVSWMRWMTISIPRRVIWRLLLPPVWSSSASWVWRHAPKNCREVAQPPPAPRARPCLALQNSSTICISLMKQEKMKVKYECEDIWRELRHLLLARQAPERASSYAFRGVLSLL